jgi:predicted ATPase
VLQNSLCEELQKLNDLWHQEFQIINKELNAISQKNAALKLSVGFKEDRDALLGYFKNIFKGSGVREATFQNIADKYNDVASVYFDFDNAKKLFGSNPDNFAGLFLQNLHALLTYQTPNKFAVTYRGTELAHHSLGQRASALILFVLGQRENDVIVIDQPEDDLDNQTIYEDVIKLIRELKPEMQFIFATHNPNIPVLGDAEQIHACSLVDEKISVQSGSLDDPVQQIKIVEIMEGGKEAFERRKEIYQTWKS